MKHLFNPKDAADILQRLSQFSSSHGPKWGKMDAHQTLVHLADPFRLALGDRPVPFNPTILGRWPFNKLIARYLPWPKGAPTSPDFIQGMRGSAPIAFAQDKQALLDLIHRFSQHQNTTPFPTHATFGNLTNKEWARVMWRHCDHHLRQFGL